MNLFKKRLNYNPFLAIAPLVVEKPILWLEKNGLNIEGIFRVSGSFSQILDIKKQLEKGEDVDLDLFDGHTIAGALMQWLSELENPLLTHELYEDFLSTYDLNDELKVIKLSEIISRLPPGNRVIFKMLLDLLRKIHLNREKNKMPCSSLAIVFGPTLLRMKQNYNGTHSNIKHDIKATCSLLEYMILHSEAIFEKVDPTRTPKSHHKRSTSTGRADGVHRQNTQSPDTSPPTNMHSSRTTTRYEVKTEWRRVNVTVPKKLSAIDPDRVISQDDAQCISSLAAVLSDAHTKKVFFKYLQEKEFSEENLLFYDKVQEYKSLHDDALRLKMLNEMLKQFIANDAPYSLNVDSDQAKELIYLTGKFASEEETPVAPLLIEMQSFVYSLMNDHSYMKFLQSAYCRKHLKEIEDGSLKLKVK
eukprot:TRINITY_DN15836_c0_g1_i1.p1 TRINITY_DN15836_c0_g1~~TRINITY_DN15836_c0_g1_i1.p1  ORF type:complete len:417 (-),score=81.13 TRINITY_DN15836_c0_g1_i1:175-1425(-)